MEKRLVPATEKVWNITIVVYEGRYWNSKQIERLEWKQLRISMVVKYSLYFEYRWAQLRLKYPKYCIEKIVMEERPNKKTQEHIKKEKLKAKRGQLTKTKNSLAGYKEEYEMFRKKYNEIFPITESKKYQDFLINIEKFNYKLGKLEQELKEIEES